MQRLKKTVLVSFFSFFFLMACTGIEHLQEIDKLIDSIKIQFAPDNRVAIFDVHTTGEAGQLVLFGKTNLPLARQALIDSLTALNIQFIDSLRILPTEEIGEKSWGLVTLSVIPLRKKPKYSAEMVSQALLGTPVKVLDKRDNWNLVQTPDQYIGWVNASGIKTITAAGLDNWKISNRYIFSQINGSVWSEPDDKSQPVSDLVLGGIFQVIAKNKNYLKIEIPDGRIGFVKKADCLPFHEWASVQPEAKNIISTAKFLLGRPYLWGGLSTKGIDCSGLIKVAYFSQGVILSRDASQQALYGKILMISNSSIFKAGDLLFFGRNKSHITHVAMYIGDDHYIHSSGRVKISSLNPHDGDFSSSRKKDLVSASRILNSLNTEQIIQVKQHPWYNMGIKENSKQD